MAHRPRACRRAGAGSAHGRVRMRGAPRRLRRLVRGRPRQRSRHRVPDPLGEPTPTGSRSRSGPAPPWPTWSAPNWPAAGWPSPTPPRRGARRPGGCAAVAVVVRSVNPRRRRHGIRRPRRTRRERRSRRYDRVRPLDRHDGTTAIVPIRSRRQPERVEVRLAADALAAVDAAAAAANVTRFGRPPRPLGGQRHRHHRPAGRRLRGAGGPPRRPRPGTRDRLPHHHGLPATARSACAGDTGAVRIVGRTVQQMLAAQSLAGFHLLGEAGRPPAYQTLFAYQNNAVPELELPDPRHLRPAAVSRPALGVARRAVARRRRPAAGGHLQPRGGHRENRGRPRQAPFRVRVQPGDGSSPAMAISTFRPPPPSRRRSTRPGRAIAGTPPLSRLRLGPVRHRRSAPTVGVDARRSPRCTGSRRPSCPGSGH